MSQTKPSSTALPRPGTREHSSYVCIVPIQASELLDADISCIIIRAPRASAADFYAYLNKGEGLSVRRSACPAALLPPHIRPETGSMFFQPLSSSRVLICRWTKDKRLLLVKSPERSKWVQVRPLPHAKNFPVYYDVRVHPLLSRTSSQMSPH